MRLLVVGRNSWGVLRLVFKPKLKGIMMNAKQFSNSALLHYPTIEFFDDTWLRACLCIWDKIYRIVPPSYSPADSDEVKLAIDEGLVENIKLQKEDLSQTADLFETFWENVSFIPAGVEGYESVDVRLHPEKVDARIRPILESLSKKVDPNGWLSLSPEVANAYMLFLAETISKRRNIPKMTSNSDMFSIIHYFSNKGNFDELVYNEDQEETIAAIVLPAILPAGLEYTHMKEVLQFRRANNENRNNFRQLIANFSDELSKIEDKEHARHVAEEFRIGLEKNQHSFLKTAGKVLHELPLASISVGLPTTLTAIGAIALAGGNPYDFAKVSASCLIGIVASISDASRSIRKSWRSSESSYLLELNKMFYSEGKLKFTIPRFNRLFNEFVND